MARTDQTEIRMRLVIGNPAPDVPHSLQDKKGQPVNPETSKDGEQLTFDFAIRVGASHNSSARCWRCMRRRMISLASTTPRKSFNPSGAPEALSH